MRKQAKSVPEMIELLKQRGLTIDVPDMPGILLDNNWVIGQNVCPAV